MHCLSEQESNQELSSVGVDFCVKSFSTKKLKIFLKNLYKITTKISKCFKNFQQFKLKFEINYNNFKISKKI